MRTRSARALILPLICAWLIAGCGSTNKIDIPSTYVGDIAQAHLEDLYLATKDGKKLAFREVFTNFEPQTGILTTALPFRKFAVADIIYEVAQPVAGHYDAEANNNGYLEGPELLVLYIRESAIGLGHDVDYLGTNPRFNALATSNADAGGLMEFVKTNSKDMTEHAQQLFEDLVQIGLDRRNRGASGKGGGSGN